MISRLLCCCFYYRDKKDKNNNKENTLNNTQTNSELFGAVQINKKPTVIPDKDDKKHNPNKKNISNMHIPKMADELKDAEWSNCKPFVPAVSIGKVIKVYDGDTITIASKIYNSETPKSTPEVYRFSVRLTGIDSPEIRGKTDMEKIHAQLAKQELSNLVLGKTVELKNVATEKYGRLLADVYINDIHVNKWMVDNGHAVLYDGGTKTRPTEWDATDS
jgi:micrococcal nuclease